MRLNLNKAKGFTLTELLISTAVSMVILLALFQILFGIQKGNQLNNSLAGFNQVSDILKNTLGNDLYMAGFSGCANVDGLTQTQYDNAAYGSTIDYRSDFVIAYNDVQVTGWAGSNSWDFLDAKLDEEKYPRSNSDILVINRLTPIPDFNGVSKHQYTSSNAKHDLTIKTSYNAFATGDTIALTNCSKLDIANITAVDNINATNKKITFAVNESGTQYNHKEQLKSFNPYSDQYIIDSTPTAVSSEIVAFVNGFITGQNIYYVGKAGVERSGNDVFALFRMPKDAITVDDAEEVFRGVELLKLRYALEDTATGNIQFTDVITRTQRNQVKGVKVAIVVSSLNHDNIEILSNEYSYFGNEVYTAPADGKLRKVIERTFMLKNRVDKI